MATLNWPDCNCCGTIPGITTGPFLMPVRFERLGCWNTFAQREFIRVDRFGGPRRKQKAERMLDDPLYHRNVNGAPFHGLHAARPNGDQHRQRKTDHEIQAANRHDTPIARMAGFVAKMPGPREATAAVK